MSKTPTLTVKFHEDSDVKQMPWTAKKDIQERNNRCQSLYTVDEQAKGYELLGQAQSTFIRSRCFINFRDTVMVIKVESVKSADKLSEAFDTFEKCMAELGAVENHRNGHYIYHIFPR